MHPKDKKVDICTKDKVMTFTDFCSFTCHSPEINLSRNIHSVDQLLGIKHEVTFI